MLLVTKLISSYEDMRYISYPTRLENKDFASSHKIWMENFLCIYIANQEHGGNVVASCPKCGAANGKLRKSWKMAGRPDKQGKRMQLEIGLYDCPSCGKTFREVLSKKKI